MKNKVEIHGDIALIHITRAGVDHIAVMDARLVKFLDNRAENKLTLDSNGAVQHKRQVNGKWYVFQAHRELIGAFDWEKISFRNGNKLDLRMRNLKSDYGK